MGGGGGWGVECFLCDADGFKRFHQSICIAGLVVCPLLSQLRFGKPVSFVQKNFGDRNAALVGSSLPDITSYSSSGIP